MTGKIPDNKAIESIDRKLIAKYGIDLSEKERSRRRKQGLANAQYLRHDRWFILMLTEGHHALRASTAKGGEGENIKDCRRIPIRIGGYAISYRRSGVATKGGGPIKWHAHVRMDAGTYVELKAHFDSIAVHRSPEQLSREFAAIPYARYAPIRRQLLNLLRRVNDHRQRQAFELLPYAALKLRRTPVKVYADSVDASQLSIVAAQGE